MYFYINSNNLFSGLLCGVIFGLFSGQPLILLGSTGPVYVFEKILYQMCKDQDWDYLNLRLWIGLWVAAILIALVALDASAYVCYITRYIIHSTYIKFGFLSIGCYWGFSGVFRGDQPVFPHCVKKVTYLLPGSRKSCLLYSLHSFSSSMHSEVSAKLAPRISSCQIDWVKAVN